MGTEDAVAGGEALDGEEAQAGSGGGAIDPRRLSGVALVVDSVSIGFGGAAERAVEAMSSGVASSVAGWTGKGDGGSAGEGASSSLGSSSSSSSSALVADAPDAESPGVEEEEGLEEATAAAASAFFACCLVFARRFWNQTWGKHGYVGELCGRRD